MTTSDADLYGNFSFEEAGGDAPAAPNPTASNPTPDGGETECEVGIACREEPHGSPAWVAFASVPGNHRTRQNGRIPGNYLVEHTVATIIRGTFKIYFRHFGTLFFIYVLPVVPVAMIEAEAERSGNTAWFILSMLLYLIVTYLASGATTVAVSDVCLGNPPSFKRSYAKILGKLVLLLLVTNILYMLAVAVGMLLLVIPGLVLYIWLILSSSVVVLERKSGVTAFKRSKQLGDGSHWRNAGLVLLLAIIMVVIGGIGGVVGGVIQVVFASAFPHLLNDWIIDLIFLAVLTGIQHGLAVPVGLISLVLVYYDRRVRKEGYDAKALAEDLAR